MIKLSTFTASARCCFCLAALLALAVQPNRLQAETVQTEEWQIEADKLLHFDNPKSVIAEGNVVLKKIQVLPPKAATQQVEISPWATLLEEGPAVVVREGATQEISQDTEPRTITEVTILADWIAYDVEKNSIKARGNITIKNDTDQLLADEGVFDLSKETGAFQEATILRQSMDLHFEGKTIEKTGVNTYHIVDGWVVTCKYDEGETPPWSFAASDTRVTQGEYAVLKHARFRIKDVPVFYTPWLILPVGNKRQTGLLFPEISTSDRNGFGFNLPLFLNISDSSDVTLYTEYYANRGLMPGIEYRYVLGAQKKATFMANYLDDDLSDPSETEYRQKTGYTHTNQERYWIRGKLDHDFSNDLITRLDIDVVSDRDYLTEFESGMTGFGDTNDRFFAMYGRGFQNKTAVERVNSLGILKAWEGMALEGTLLGINDVRTKKTSPTPLWKLPSLDFTGSLPVAETGITFDWDADYVNYYREDGVGGHRVDLYPRLSMPLPLGPYLESRAEAGIRDTFYNVQTYGDSTWEESSSPNRLLADFHTEIGTTLLRDFVLNVGETTGFRHNFRPYVQYDYLSDTDQDDLPDFDSVDRIDDQNIITYGIDNFFKRFGTSGGVNTEKEYSRLKISQSYDLRSEESDTPFSPVNIQLRWNPIDALRVIYKTDIGVYGEGVTFYGLETYYKNSRGDHLTVDYRYDDEDSVHQLNLDARAQLFDTIFAGYAIEHSLSEDETIEQDISLIYQPACWSVELRSSYTPGDHSIKVIFNLANIGNPLGIRL